jgi:cytochrome c2
MSDEFYNHDKEGSVFTSLILLIVFMLGCFVVARIHEPSQAIGADKAKGRLATREKIDSAADSKLAGNSVINKEKKIISLPIATAISKFAELSKVDAREELIKRSIEKDGKYEPPRDVSKVDLSDPSLIAKGKVLFQSKTCWTCHQVDPAIPSPAGMAIKAPVFIGDFWGKEREVHIGYNGPIQKVIRNEEYFIESVMKPMAKVAKGALAPMVIAPGLVNNEEVTALMAYVKSLSK